MSFKPTQEQEEALAAFLSGSPLVIEAGAGTGKTATLQLLARAAPERAGQYTAFNRAIVDDAATKMPPSVSVKTGHALAFASVGRNYSHRLKGRRVPSNQLARMLDAKPVTFMVGTAPRALSDGYVASLAMRSVERFCFSDDPEPAESHVPYVDGIDIPADGKRTYQNNNALRAILVPLMRRAWEDIQRKDGVLPFKHAHYLKMWQLSNPRIAADFILFDEAQDVNPVMAAIMSGQTHAQRVYVGDSNQSIYGWMGAIDAIATLKATPGAKTTTLTQSFRFGPAIAEVANAILEMLPTELRIRGLESIESVVAPTSTPDAILTRTNARSVIHLFDETRRGRKAHLVGGGTEVMMFARAANDLQRNGFTSHPDLAIFQSWGEVIAYSESDPQGDELRLLVSLVDEFGADRIATALERMPSASYADVVISTAHKAKGLQWPSVVISDDFPDPEKRDGGLSDEDLRLLYVACTRAQRVLDISRLAWLKEGIDG